MRQNRVKKVMREGKLALGAYVSIADPQVVEIIGLAGFDAAFIDMEHTAFDLPLIEQMARAAELVGVTSMVRVPDNDAKLILRLLDMGVEGIIIPHVDGVEGAKKAVAAVRYPPLGERGGAGGTRAARFGTVPWSEHVRQSNEEIVLAVMTEDQKAMGQIEEIAALDGVDIVSLGPTDVSQALGVSGPSDPRLIARVREIADTIKKVGKAKLAIPMYHAALPLGPQDLMELGAGYTHVGPPPPAVLLRTMRESVERVHKEIGRTS
ncbi:MAG: aldolase/citrate lyase family protein [Chloroflexi bacterium]|nr:aldolase/citrate lyase family protein [Chloroflexota bacterium]